MSGVKESENKSDDEDIEIMEFSGSSNTGNRNITTVKVQNHTNNFGWAPPPSPFYGNNMNRSNMALNLDGNSDENLNTWVLPKESLAKESSKNNSRDSDNEGKDTNKNGEQCVVMGKKSLKIVPINQLQDGTTSQGVKRKLADDDEIVSLPTPRSRPPVVGRTQNTLRDPKSDDMAKMIGKLAARLDFLEQGQGGAQETPKSLKDRIRLLEENAIKSIHGDENEFVRKPYLKAKLRPLEDRIEPLESYSTEIEDLMDRLTKAEENITDLKNKLVSFKGKSKDLEGRLDSLEESVASKVIKAIKDSSSTLGAISKNINLNPTAQKSNAVKVKAEPGTTGELGEEFSNLKQQFNNMDILVTRSLEETTKSNHFLAARIQKLEENFKSKDGDSVMSQMELLRQNSSNLNVLSARVETLEDASQPHCKRSCKSETTSNTPNRSSSAPSKTALPSSSIVETSTLNDLMTFKTENIDNNEGASSLDKILTDSIEKDLGISNAKTLDTDHGLLNIDDLLMNTSEDTNVLQAEQNPEQFDQIMDMLDEMQSGAEKNDVNNINNKSEPQPQNANKRPDTIGSLKILGASQINALDDRVVAEGNINTDNNSKEDTALQESSEDSISQLRITNVESALESPQEDSDTMPLTTDTEVNLPNDSGKLSKESSPSPKKKSPVKIKLKYSQNSIKIRDNTEEDIAFNVQADNALHHNSIKVRDNTEEDISFSVEADEETLHQDSIKIRDNTEEDNSFSVQADDTLTQETPWWMKEEKPF